MLKWRRALLLCSWVYFV